MNTVLVFVPVLFLLSPNWALGCLSIILGCLHRFLFIFRLLVGILPVLFSFFSPPSQKKKENKTDIMLNNQTKSA